MSLSRASDAHLLDLLGDGEKVSARFQERRFVFFSFSRLQSVIEDAEPDSSFVADDVLLQDMGAAVSSPRLFLSHLLSPSPSPSQI